MNNGIANIQSIKEVTEFREISSKDVKFWLTIGVIVFTTTIKIIDAIEKNNPPKKT